MKKVRTSICEKDQWQACEPLKTERPIRKEKKG